ncbi:PHD finger protein 20-like protein 1 isoform X2 [Scyliorhinus canicula]|uniref:PHD finger protein 20-like protein 1 isoform X2 n=1 Tax=Scyliorhinus canicula TaxID=7830 RepID=UPI0018F786EC|nr:PHD finger protein 20-like protein 1 isoform X2 [Scyliorhinus canicula]
MSRNPPSRPGIVFAVGARLEAQDYLQKWYTSRIEKIDYEEGKMLIHFERWSHRYNEWIYWDSHRLRPLEGQSLRKEALKDDEEITDFKTGDEVLARWTDCRYYPAKIEDISEEGTYTVQFYDGVIRSLKRMHIKSMPEDAKGQDWLALVKAATAAAAAKNKTVSKHRVHKEKVERKMGRGSHFKKERVMSEVKETEDEAHKTPEGLAPVAISGNSEPLTFDEPKQTSGQAETSGARKRKASVTCSFQAKRARLNKITGLLASKAVSGDGSEMLEDGIGSHHVPDQRVVNLWNSLSWRVAEAGSLEAFQVELSPTYTTDQLKTEVSSGDSCPLNQKSDPFSSSPPSTKFRTRKTKPEEPSGNIKASDPAPTPTVPQGKELHNIEFPQTLPPPPPSDIPQTGPFQPSSPSTWLENSQRRRRSARLANAAGIDGPTDQEYLPSPSSDMTGQSGNSNNLTDSNTPEDSDGYQFLPRESNVFEFSDLVPLDLSQHSRHKTSASVSSLQLPGKEQTMKPHSKIITDVSVASSSSVTNAKKTEDPLAPKELVIELDHNKFKCKFPRCFKAFRKAKLLDYHVKYYHNTEKGSDTETSSLESGMRTRATSANMPASPVDSLGLKGRRPLSSSSSPSSNLPALQLEMPLDISHKPSKVCKKKRSSASFSTEGTNNHPIPSVKEKSVETVHEKILRKCVDRDRNAEVGKNHFCYSIEAGTDLRFILGAQFHGRQQHSGTLPKWPFLMGMKSEKKMKYEEKNSMPGKKKERGKEKKGKEHVKLKQKKKKKKKKKSKHDFTECEGFKDISLEFLERCPSPITKPGSSLALRCGSVVKPAYLSPKSLLSSGSLLELSMDHTPRHECLSDDEFFDGSSTESALMSDDYSQDLDVSSTAEESQEEDDSNATVRCVCGMDEENGFMIQCEECLCWQHSICMGLLEDSIPDQYICYICRDPTGQKWSAKYCYDKEWLKNGHMYGLSFLKENYSQQNSKKIVSTHQLLADVYSVTEVLRGLQMKINTLQSKKHPDLHLWAQSCIKSTQEQTTGKNKDTEHMDGLQQPENTCHNQRYREKSSPSERVEGAYITSEHSYQKPQGCSLEQNTTIDQDSSEDDDTNRLEYEEVQSPAFNTTERCTVQEEDCLSGQGSTEIKEMVTVSNDGSCDGMAGEEHVSPQFPWQLNLLTHIEDVQNEVNSRMDFIEKELDVLESWLEFSGDLESPEPLARLPQLKRHIKQLLKDLAKVEQMATCCSL